MILLHTSDWHLGMPVGAGSYEEDHRFFLEQLLQVIRTRHVGAVLLAGDVYDSSVSNAAAISVYNDAVTAICAELGIPMIVIAGNHDSASRLSSCRHLLCRAGLHVTGKLERPVDPVLLDGGRVAIYPLPFFNRDEAAALFPEHKAPRNQEQAMDLVCSEIRATMDPTRFNVVLSHALTVNAALSDSDRSARIGFATAVSHEVFRDFDYAALGHIHKPQVVSSTVRYSGSPIKFSFGTEETQVKGVVLVDTETGQQEFVPIPLFRDRKTVSGSYEALLTREDLADCRLRMEVTDRYAGLELWADLQSRFPYLLELRGKSLDEQNTLTALSVDELHAMDEADIMRKFLAENFEYEPTDDQLQLFQEVLAWSEEEDDLG